MTKVRFPAAALSVQVQRVLSHPRSMSANRSVSNGRAGPPTLRLMLMQLCDNCQPIHMLTAVTCTAVVSTRKRFSRMDFELARTNMIESQIRTWDVLDQAVLDAIAAVKREDFVADEYRSLAFADMQIPLGHGEVMLTPKLEARMLQEFRLLPEDKVLEIGTGSGYVTALLCSLARSVVSIEIVPAFTQMARTRLRAANIDNVTLEVADAADGWEQAAPYDGILLTGSVPELPDAFRRQLSVGGRLLAVIGEEPAMTATLISRVSETDYTSTRLFETCIPPLRNIFKRERFVF